MSSPGRPRLETISEVGESSQTAPLEEGFQAVSSEGGSQVASLEENLASFLIIATLMKLIKDTIDVMRASIYFERTPELYELADAISKGKANKQQKAIFSSMLAQRREAMGGRPDRPGIPGRPGRLEICSREIGGEEVLIDGLINDMYMEFNIGKTKKHRILSGQDILKEVIEVLVIDTIGTYDTIIGERELSEEQLNRRIVRLKSDVSTQARSLQFKKDWRDDKLHCYLNGLARRFPKSKASILSKQ